MTYPTLIPSSWEKPINSVNALNKALKDNKEFQVVNVNSKWYGATTTAKELVAEGIKMAQVRYGHRMEKAILLRLPGADKDE